MSPTTACTTGLHALTEAASIIRLGQSKLCVAGASEACVHPLALSGFARARSLSTGFNDCPREASRPFDKSRDGFVMGEGAGILILEELENARHRGAKIYAELKGFGLSCDAWHMTAPWEDGHGAKLAMERALQDAEVKPRDVGYINAHATSTLLGDAAENRAVKDVFLPASSVLPGEHHPSPAEVTVSSTKGATGHLLGAAGAVEAIFTILALQSGTIPPTLNLHRPGNGSHEDDDTEEYNLNYVPHTSISKNDVSTALTNSFGFGGTNASVCFTRFDGR